jgi:hypothetical protein
VVTKAHDIYVGYRGYDLSVQDNCLSFRIVHGWPANAVKVKCEQPLSAERWHHVAVTYDGSSRAAGIRIFVDGTIQPVTVENDNLVKDIKYNWHFDGKPRLANLYLGNRKSFEKIEFAGLVLDEIRIYDRVLSGLEAGLLADVLQPEQSAIMEEFPEAMVMRERLQKRKTFVLRRGRYDALATAVDFNLPKTVMAFPDSLPKNRLGLTRWLLHPNNPLTARVVVNRFWQMYFGQGIVSTPEDFGNQGALPTHPDLLDWLATEFLDSGWDIKALQKKIVMSATYRQSSRGHNDGSRRDGDRDPENRFLARGPRHRLSAEMIRDNALAISGLLVKTIGGPSVKPYQPEGLWAAITSGRHLTKYEADKGDALYRRSLYTFWKRTVPPPYMITFDVPERNACTVRRQKTSTPLQSLNLMNDPQFVEAARMFAERMIIEGGSDPEQRIRFAFRLATARFPEEQELHTLLSLFRRQLKRYQERSAAADTLLSVGDYRKDKELDSTELAAYTLVANTILNLYETLTKG